jgi:uncharacterized membrane protein YkoI
MIQRALVPAIAGVAVVGAMLAFTRLSSPGPEDKHEVEVKLTDVPAPVRGAIAKLTAESAVRKVVKETKGGVTVYEVEYTAGGADVSAKLTDSGMVLELERAAPALPEAARAALGKAFPGATIGAASAVQAFYYEVAVTAEGHKREVKVDASGEIHGDGHGGDEKDEDEQDDDDQ